MLLSPFPAPCCLRCSTSPTRKQKSMTSCVRMLGGLIVYDLKFRTRGPLYNCLVFLQKNKNFRGYDIFKNIYLQIIFCYLEMSSCRFFFFTFWLQLFYKYYMNICKAVLKAVFCICQPSSPIRTGQIFLILESEHCGLIKKRVKRDFISIFST